MFHNFNDSEMKEKLFKNQVIEISLNTHEKLKIHQARLTGRLCRKVTLKEAASDALEEYFKNVFKTNKNTSRTKEDGPIPILSFFEKTKSVEEGFLSSVEIIDMLKRENLDLSTNQLAGILKRAGFVSTRHPRTRKRGYLLKMKYHKQELANESQEH